MKIIELKNIFKKFNDNLILNNISLSVKKGEVITLIGPSGGGKSTVLRCINFLEEADEGNIYYNGVMLDKKNINNYRGKIGMVFQNFNLFPNLSVSENIYLAPCKNLGLSQSEGKNLALSLLAKVGLAGFHDQAPNSLSGGQKQRVAIARSLAMNPEILLLDEPTSALDPEMVFDVLSVIKSFVHTGITIIMATHEMSFAKNFSDQIIFLADGKIHEIDAPEQFFKMPQTIRAQNFLAKLLS